jgi:Stringent starvation protein B
VNAGVSDDLPSTKPYLIRAIHEWCSDHGFTPHIIVKVDDGVRVPREFVRDGQIVFNVGYEATGSLQITNDGVSFQARFGGVVRDIFFPMDNVAAVYARENGAGMTFEAKTWDSSAPRPTQGTSPDADGETAGLDKTPPPPGRPRLQRIK